MKYELKMTIEFNAEDMFITEHDGMSCVGIKKDCGYGEFVTVYIPHTVPTDYVVGYKEKTHFSSYCSYGWEIGENEGEGIAIKFPDYMQNKI